MVDVHRRARWIAWRVICLGVFLLFLVSFHGWVESYIGEVFPQPLVYYLREFATDVRDEGRVGFRGGKEVRFETERTSHSRKQGRGAVATETH
jgi:hypothetical protein